MQLITRDTDYAIRALCYMAAKKEKIIADELVKELKIPKAFLRKILQLLNKSNVLISNKGLKGGFILALPPEKILLIDIIKIFQGDLELCQCLFKKKVCPNKRACFLREQVIDIQNYAIKKLGLVSIVDVIRGLRK